MNKDILNNPDNFVFYTSKNCLGHLYTTCMLTVDGKLLSRGVAVKNLTDTNNKKLGRRLAKKEAIKAFLKQRDVSCSTLDFDFEEMLGKGKEIVTKRQYKVGSGNFHEFREIIPVDFILDIEETKKNDGIYIVYTIRVPAKITLFFTYKEFKKRCRGHWKPMPTEREKRILKYC